MKKYMTPDFDVTVYEIKERITLDLDIGGGDADGFNTSHVYGDLTPEL